MNILRGMNNQEIVNRILSENSPSYLMRRMKTSRSAFYAWKKTPAAISFRNIDKLLEEEIITEEEHTILLKERNVYLTMKKNES